jgi:hypothetical protein
MLWKAQDDKTEEGGVCSLVVSYYMIPGETVTFIVY